MGEAGPLADVSLHLLFLPSQVSPPACACQEKADKPELIVVGQVQCVLPAAGDRRAGVLSWLWQISFLWISVSSTRERSGCPGFEFGPLPLLVIRSQASYWS